MPSNLSAFQQKILHARRQLLVDCGVTSTSRYSKTREGLRSDARYQAMPRDAREPAFKQYTAELQVCTATRTHQVKAKQGPNGRKWLWCCLCYNACNSLLTAVW